MRTFYEIRQNNSGGHFCDEHGNLFDAEKPEQDVTAKLDSYRAMCERLADDLAYMASQHRCGCGHPACNRCADEAMCEAALADYNKLVEQGSKA